MTAPSPVIRPAPALLDVALIAEEQRRIAAALRPVNHAPAIYPEFPGAWHAAAQSIIDALDGPADTAAYITLGGRAIQACDMLRIAHRTHPRCE